MMTRLLHALLVLTIAIAAGACAGSTPGGTGANADAAGSGPVCTETVNCAGGIPTSYPNGPFADDDDPVGEKLEDHVFTTADEGTLSFGDIRSAGGKTLLLISTTAGWCTACIEEQPKLEAYYQQYGCDGLEVMVAIFQDIQFNAATAALANQWETQYGLSFPVVADTDNVLSTYYDSGAAPLNMLVDLCTMRVLYVSIGFDETAVTAQIESHLGL